MAMNAQDIDGYLAELGQKLLTSGIAQPVRLLMVGGADMLTQIGNRPSTQDIDVLLEDIPDPSTSPLYHPLQRAVRTVAARHGLPMNWINDVIGDALRNYGPIPRGTIRRVYGPLEVLVPERAYILALKLLAHRAQDDADIRVLCHELRVSTRDEARLRRDALRELRLLLGSNGLGSNGLGSNSGDGNDRPCLDDPYEMLHHPDDGVAAT